MYYILYNRKTLKVEHIDTQPLKPQDMSFYGIAEYKGEIPQNNWLTVDNIHEEIETWTEKELVEKEVKKIVPKVVKTSEPVYDDNGEIIDYKIFENTIEKEVVEIVEEEVEVEKSKTHIVCDLVPHFYPQREPTQKQLAAKRIAELEKFLDKTDYKAIKYAEGRLSQEEYAPIGEQRQAWRDEINELEKLL